MEPTPWYTVLWHRWPDFVVTFLGVFVAAFLSYQIERKITRDQEAREQTHRDRHARQHLIAYLQRVNREIHDNAQYTSKLLVRFDERSSATDELSIHRLPLVLEWGVAVAEALSVTAYDDMARSGLQRLLPDDLQDDLFDVRQRTVDLKAAVRSSEREMASLWFVSEPSRQDIFENLRKLMRTTEDALRRVNKGTHQYLSEQGVKVEL